MSKWNFFSSKNQSKRPIKNTWIKIKMSDDGTYFTCLFKNIEYDNRPDGHKYWARMSKTVFHSKSVSNFYWRPLSKNEMMAYL